MEAGQSPPRRRPHAALAAAVRALREERRLPPACWLDRLFDATLSNTMTWSEKRGLLMSPMSPREGQHSFQHVTIRRVTSSRSSVSSAITRNSGPTLPMEGLTNWLARSTADQHCRWKG